MKTVYLVILFFLFFCGCGKNKQQRIPTYAVSGNGKKFNYIVRCEPAHYPELRHKGAISSLSVSGNFNNFIPDWRLQRYQKGKRILYGAQLKLTNGVYRYRFMVDFKQSAPAYLYDRAWRFLFDAGWAGKKDRKLWSRSCLYERRSGFRAYNGKKLPLKGGVRE